ncbi:MAG: hypothetical protein ACK559_26290 [bacterium]
MSEDGHGGDGVDDGSTGKDERCDQQRSVGAGECISITGGEDHAEGTDGAGDTCQQAP